MAFSALFEHKKTHGKTTVRRTFYEKMRYKNVRLSLIPHSGIFEFVRRPKQEMIDYALTHGVPMQVGKFLVKKFAEEIGLTIEDLKQLQPLIDKLDTQHEYERIIYEYIMENGSWDIPIDIRDAAYKAYKSTRSNQKDLNPHAKQSSDYRNI